jgi:DNA-binding HxlR family transcriptional regulator
MGVCMTYESKNSDPTLRDVVDVLREKARVAIESNKKAKADWGAYVQARDGLLAIGIQLPADLPMSLDEPETKRAASTKPVKRKPSEVTWKSAILKIVQTNGEIGYRDLKAELAGTAIGPRLKKSDKAFYNALSRLEESGDLVRHNAHAFTPKVFEQYKRDVESGKRSPVEAKAPGREALSHVQNGILDILRSHPEGLQGAEIIDKMSPCNDKSVYNTLNRLVRQNRLHKDVFNKSYRLPELIGPTTERAVVSLFGEPKAANSQNGGG